MNFRDKTVVLGVTGGIAAYKACDVVSKLRKYGLNIHVIMTKSACEFVNPLTFQTLSANYVISDMFQDPKTWEIEHIELAKKADVFVVAPASANIIGKLANGICDDMLTTTVCATEAPIYIAPAMNTRMYEKRIVQDNIAKLKDYGFKFIDPAEGKLACGDTGRGKLADTDYIVSVIMEEFTANKDYKGKKVLITAGPTVESIDPVRYITNRSTGKMGYSIAAQAVRRGAEVTLISGPTNLKPPSMLKNFIGIQSAEDLYREVTEHFDSHDVIIQSAAVADYKPKTYSSSKIKKSDDDFKLELGRNKDIALELGKIKGNKILVGFAAESDDLIKNATRKIEKKNLDFIVANDITKAGSGFSHDTNIVKIIDARGKIEEYPMLTKSEVANIILDKVKEIIKK